VRVLWVGDAVVSSGFSRCTHAACDALHAAGHDVHVLGLNYFGDPHEYPYPVYPCVQPHDGGRDGWGLGRLPRMVARLKPDVVVLLNDPWNVPGYLKALEQLPEGTARPPIVGWLAVDAKNQAGEPLNDLARVVTWTRFAADELRGGGYRGECSIVPLGVDLDVFYPRDRAGARATVLPAGVPQDAFVVGVVGRNQLRKRLDLTIQYFAEWVRPRQRDDAYLYLHVAPTGDSGCDVRSLVRYYGLHGRVVVAEPHIGHGDPTSRLPLLYSSFDAYLTTTQGEGWGLPCLEAMACGVPCVVPDWSALGDWTEGAALKVPCSGTALTAPLNALAYTIGGIADREGTVRALERLYCDARLRATYRERGLELAKRLPWSAAGRRFVAVLEDVIGERREVA
jgi:D-inositol-3-phosphate glycosyltransferase